MKKLIGVIMVVLVLAAGYVGAAYWSGLQAERWYKDALVEASKHPNIKITALRYERGLLVSKATTHYQLLVGEAGDATTMPDLSFSTREEIYHGPIPLAGWGVPGVPMTLAGAVIRQTLDPESSDWTRELKTLYGGQEPMVGIAQVSFDGASNAHVTMPPLTLNNVQDLQTFKFSGLQGQFQTAPRGTAIQGKMVVASLEAIGKPATHEATQPATAGSQIHLRDLAVTANQRKGVFDLMLGESNLKIAELRVQDPSSSTPIVFTDLGMDATAALSPQNPQQINVEALFKAGKFTVEPWNGTGSMKLAFHNLDGATIGQLQQWQEKIAAQPNDPQALDQLLKLVKALLHGKPEFALDTQAKLAQGDWLGQLTLNFQDYGTIDPMQNPTSLLNALKKGLAEMTVSKNLAETVLVSIANASGEVPQDTAQQQVTQQLQGAVSAGFIRLEGDQYKSTVRFEGGKLFVNDKAIPLGPADMENGAVENGIPPAPDSAEGGHEKPQN